MFMVICMTKKKKKNIKIKSSNSFDNSEIKKMIIVTSVVLIVFCAFYFLTVMILDKDNNSDNDVVSNEVEIQHEEILLGTSFSVNEDEYLVVYYDFSSDDVYDLTSAVSTYRSSSKEINLYSVDMSDALNKQFIGDTSNKDATKASEISINGPTLIKFTNNKISMYVEGIDKIVDYLK